MASILQQIGTPLQLVALFLLLIAGVARLLLRSGALKSAPGTTRLVINRMFQAAVAALVLGVIGPVAAPVFDRWLNSDETFHGAVLSTTGEAIPGATVTLITIGAETTGPLGQFNFTVPRNRVLKQYEVQVRAPGYASLDRLTKTDAEMRNVEFRLAPAPPELVKALEAPLFIGQFLGYPFALITLRVENASASLASMEIRGVLKSKDASFTLSPVAWTIYAFGAFAPVTGAFPIPAGMKFDLRIVMMTGTNFGNLYAKVTALPEYRSQLPCVAKLNGGADPMTAAAFEITKDFSDEHFSWRAGDWRLELDATTENQAKNFAKDFSLSTGEIAQLRNSIALARQCMAINTASPLAQDGSLANFLSK